jgi:hypothetical protein|tara:strand:+ start:678 stop:839 length:162 start_codon:yes stop_codon:yes gene_type:complete
MALKQEDTAESAAVCDGDLIEHNLVVVCAIDSSFIRAKNRPQLCTHKTIFIGS